MMEGLSFDRKGFEELTRQRSAGRSAQTSQPALHLLAQAAVPAAVLMADPNWSVYQQMLQAAVDRTIANRLRLADTLASPAGSTYEQMTRIKHLMAECDGLIAAWKTAISLPRDLVENAERAQKVLDFQVEKYDPPTGN